MAIEVKIAPSWKGPLEKEFEKEYFENLIQFIKQEYPKRRPFIRPAKKFSERLIAVHLKM